MRSRHLGILLFAVALSGCQNWDLLRPPEGQSAREFTPIGEGRATLTNALALERLAAIEAAEPSARLDLVEAFQGEYAQARMIPEVHRLAGEAHLGLGDPQQAAERFDRALVLTRSDMLGMPLDPELPLQLGLARMSAGDAEEGLRWLVRTYLVDRSERVQQALRFAHAEVAASAPFESWLSEEVRSRTLRAPDFTLPGLLQEQVALASMAGKATLINFWSPT